LFVDDWDLEMGIQVSDIDRVKPTIIERTEAVEASSEVLSHGHRTDTQHNGAEHTDKAIHK
jgi:hypothetical protein